MPKKRSGPPYRRVVITFWNDADVKHPLTFEEKSLLVYLITNEHSHACGLYRLPLLYVHDETGIPRERALEIMTDPLSPFVTYDSRTDEVLVHKMGRHQIDGGLHGKDKRILWFMSQLSMIQSKALLRTFRDLYADWNFDFSTLLPGAEGASEGASEGPSAEPWAGSDRAKKEGASQGPSEGASEASSSSSIQKDYTTSSHSSGNSLRGEVESKAEQRDTHPDTDRLWSGPTGLRSIVFERWHLGQERVEIPGREDDIGIGLEHALLSSLLHATGDPDFIDWAVRNAPRVFGWSLDEPHTLYWLAGDSPDAAANLSRIDGEYRKAEIIPTPGLPSAKTMPGPTPRTDRMRQLHQQLDRARAR